MDKPAIGEVRDGRLMARSSEVMKLLRLSDVGVLTLMPKLE